MNRRNNHRGWNDVRVDIFPAPAHGGDMPRKSDPVRALLLTWLAAGLALGVAPAHGFDPGSDLYRARTIVTGTDMRSRPDGIRRTFLDVLIKSSGDPSLAADPRIGQVEADADAAMSYFLYEDRLSQIPLHDEQGSRDRPYDLTVGFDPARVAAALAGLGRKVWGGDRPALLFRLLVRDRRGSYVLTADGHASERAREALADAAARYAMLAILAPSAGGDDAGDVPRFGELHVPGAIVVGGELAWTDAAFGYVGHWTMSWAGAEHRWTIEGASLDEAFRNAVSGAMQILSGNGAPR